MNLNAVYGKTKIGGDNGGVKIPDDGKLMHADTILYGGDIITIDEMTASDGKVEAIAISGGEIIEVGNMETVFSHKGPDTEVIFLNQHTLLPGLIEPHMHAILASKMRSLYKFVNISGAKFRYVSNVEQNNGKVTFESAISTNFENSFICTEDERG